MNVAETRDKLAVLGDPATVLANFFAFTPMALQVYRADGTCLMVNEAFRRLFGSAPPPGYNVLRDEVATERGMLDRIQRAFAGEIVHVPPFWYDPRELRQVEVEEGRRVAIEGNLVPLRDASGEVAFVIVLFHDRTDEMLAQQRAEQLLAREQAARADAETQRERLYTIFDQVPASIAIVRMPELIYELSNPKNQEMSGGRALAGRRLVEAMPELHEQGVTAMLEQVYRTGELVTFPEKPVQVRQHDGELRELYLSGLFQPLRSASGRVEGVMAFAYDVTELVEARRRAEALAVERAASEARFRRLHESGVIGVVFWTREGRLVDANDAFLQMIGYTRQELVDGRVRWRDMTPPEHADLDERAFAEMEQRGLCTPYEKEYIHKDGHRVPIQLGVAFWEGSTSEGVAWILDITRRKRAEKRERLLVEAGRLLSSSLDVEEMMSKLGHIAVQAWATMARVELLGDDGQLSGLVSVAHRDPGLEALARTMRERYPPGPRHPASVTARTGTSRIMPLSPELLSELAEDDEHRGMLEALGVRCAITVPLASRGRVLGALTFGRGDRVYDEDDLATAEELGRRAGSAIDNAQLFAAAQEERGRAEEASRAKDEFLAVVSHELRTPLNAMLGWTRMLRMGTLDAEKQARALETVERNAKAQAQLVEDLLDVSRIISGKLRLNVGPVSLPQVIEAAIDAVRPGAEAKGVRLVPVLDPAASPVVGDPDRLQQVTWNLLSNAVRHTPRGGRVQVQLARVESHVEITVEDTGEGIPHEFLPCMFERFRQADVGTTRRYGGLGLGLAITKHLVELHGGVIRAFSEGVGKGATFVVRLPLSPVRTVSASGPGAPAHAPSQWPASLPRPPELEGLRVLIVEDEDDSRELLRSVLEHCGMKVTAVASAVEALSILREARPDALVSDIGMPGMDGYELIRRVRALPPEQGGRTPAIALTAYARMEDRARALLAGFTMHVPKPIEPAELVVVLANVTGRISRS